MKPFERSPDVVVPETPVTEEELVEVLEREAWVEADA